MRLNYSHRSESVITEGVRRLGKAIRDEQEAAASGGGVVGWWRRRRETGVRETASSGVVVNRELCSWRTKVLTRDEILRAFDLLDAELGRRGCKAECYLVGGAVMCLALNARPSTKDVDAWFTEPTVVRDAARVVAADLGLPDDWLNDAAKGFIPAGAGFDRWRTLPHLEVSVADDRTLLAMKCAASRTVEDAGDIRILTQRLGLRTVADVLSVVVSFYPEEQLPVRTRLLLEEMFDEGG